MTEHCPRCGRGPDAPCDCQPLPTWHDADELPPDHADPKYRQMFSGDVMLRWDDGAERRGFLSYWLGWQFYDADGLPQVCEDEECGLPQSWRVP